MAARLQEHLGGKRMTYGEAGQSARCRSQPTPVRGADRHGPDPLGWCAVARVWTVPAPAIEPRLARLELARRYFHIFGPARPEAFAEWAGLAAKRGIEAFGALGTSATAVRAPVGDAWILTRDEQTFRAPPGPMAPARLLPSGDTFFLLWGVDRELLVPDADRRRALWTSRV